MLTNPATSSVLPPIGNQSVNTSKGSATVYQYEYEEEAYEVSLLTSQEDADSSIQTLLQMSYRRISETVTNSQISPNDLVSKNYGLSAEPLDMSPEAVSQRIFDFATSLFGIYQQQNPDANDSDLLKSFVSEVRKGFEEGFNDAVKILKALNALTPEVEEKINKTRDLFMKKLDDLLQSAGIDETQAASQEKKSDFSI